MNYGLVITTVKKLRLLKLFVLLMATVDVVRDLNGLMAHQQTKACRCGLRPNQTQESIVLDWHWTVLYGEVHALANAVMSALVVGACTVLYSYIWFLSP